MPNPLKRSPALQKRNDIVTLSLDFTGGSRPTPQIYKYRPLKPLRIAPFASADYESFYTKQYSLKLMSPWAYVSHPAFNAYLISILKAENPEEWEIWVGHPKDCPWKEYSHLPWVSHNAGFDHLVHLKNISLGRIDDVITKEWNCSSDMARYLQVPGALKDAVAALMGEDVDKSNRSNMLGMTNADAATIDMARMDAVWCAEIWNQFSDQWPKDEQFVSRETRKQGWRGVAVNVEKSISDSAKCRVEMGKIQRQLPWAARGETVYSYKKLRAHCYRIGIHPPPSLSLEDAGTKLWHDQFKNKFPWVKLLQDFNILKQRKNFFDLILERKRKDDTVPFNIKYIGAQPTARFQSEEDMRMQNLAKDEHYGIKERDKFIPRKGCKFAIADSSQIEPRVLNWLVGNREFLLRCAQGMSPYEAFARASGAYTTPGSLKKNSPALYALYKAQVLALGYQAAAEKYCGMALTKAGLKVFVNEPAMVGPKLDSWTIDKFKKEEAAGRLDPKLYTRIPSGIETVETFRAQNQLIAGYRDGIWKRVEREMEMDIGRHHFVTLPSGRIMRYYDVHRDAGGSLMATVVFRSPIPIHKKDWYGGKLTENRVQGISRDILVYFINRIIRELPDCKVIWTVHDEIITEVPEHVAEERLAQILKIMGTPPPWAKGLPVAAEGSIENCYTK